jgi:hypothetical protein
LGNPIAIAQDKLAQYLVDKYYLNDFLVTLKVFKEDNIPPIITVSYSDERDRTDAGMFINDLMENFNLTLDGVKELASQ